MANFSVHIVDDEKNIRRSFEIILRTAKYRVRTFESGEEYLENIEKNAPDVLFLDVMLPGMDGMAVLKRVREISPETDIVMISGHANLSMAVEAANAGAYDFLEKPLNKERILLILRNLRERRSLQTKVDNLQQSVAEDYQLIGESPAMQAVLSNVQKVAPTDSKVLVTGESGVGKELIAYAIHQHSQRAGEAFIKMNCAAIPEDLTESELFGNEKGAFTGASERRDGKFLQANGGTFFLDEIGDMSLKVQTKVLRVLQDGEFQRVGGKEVLKVNVRIIAATNKPLEAMVQEGTFREDLYFRLNVLPIEVPPLRERQDDIALLAQHFIQRYTKRNNRRAPMVKDSVFRILKSYAWPGNIRELQNLVERLIIFSENNEIRVEDLPQYLYQPSIQPSQIKPGSKTLSEVREDAERRYIEHLSLIHI